MEHPKETGKKQSVLLRRTLYALTAMALAAFAGAAYAVLGFGGRSNYTEPGANPSVSGRSLVAVAAAQRRLPDDFVFTDRTGRELRLDHFKGRVVLVNLWATWCPPCVAEMPDLNALQKTAGGPDFQVAAVSLDRAGKAVVEKWHAASGLDALDIYNADPRDFPGAYLPTSILLDKQGRVAWTGSGAYPWAGKAARDLIDQVRAEP